MVNIESWVRRGCVFAHDSFTSRMDWLLERMVRSGATLVSFGQASFTDLDFADDVSLLAKLFELLIPALEIMADEAASLGLKVNWQKTKIQALGRTEGVPLTITVKDHEVAVAEEFVYLGSLIHSSVQSTHDINRRSAISRAAIQSLDNQIWRLRVSTSAKLKLYNTCILPIFLYGSDCWAVSNTDAQKIDAFDQWLLSTNAAMYQMAPVCSKWWGPEANRTTQTHCNSPRHLTLFEHIARMDDNTDAKRILSTLPPEDWRRPRECPRITWLSTIQQALRFHNLALPETMHMAQNRSLWRMRLTYGATQSWVACQKRRWRRMFWHCSLGDSMACKKLGVGLLVVTISLELCTSYSSSCHHNFHILAAIKPANPGLPGKIAVKTGGGERVTRLQLKSRWRWMWHLCSCVNADVTVDVRPLLCP